MTLAAYTEPGGFYPPYFNATRDGDEVVVTVRAPGVERKGVYVCMHAPGPGNCTPGGPTCNNYCNMAPQKGPMQDHPLPCTHHDCGVTASMRIPVAEFRRMLAEMEGGLS